MAESLGRYRAKRDFAATPEPPADAPASPAAAPRFVVQEHHARRLHWDLRLERDGALVSWAVPRGIPQDPRQNHLAVHVEDHPLSYIDFAGEIPAGQYGAGTVTVWDHGTYECHKFREDEVMVTLHGERVTGRYVLFRTRGEDWMIHRMDPPADPGREPMPERLAPMLARLGSLPRDGQGWAYEVKWDGVRALAYVESGRVRLESRNALDVTSHYPELRALGAAMGATPAILDGEVVALDEAGRPSFERLQGRIHLASERAIRRRMEEVPVTYMAFDVLYVDGRLTTALPYAERRELLEGLALSGPAWRVPAAHRGEGDAFLEATRGQGLEGIVAKRLDAPYEPGRRSGAWVKVKNTARQDMVIGGWLPGEGRRRATIGALVVGVHDVTPAQAAARGEPQRLRFAGRVGTGFDDAMLLRLRETMAPQRAESPFDGRQPPRTTVFVEPRLVAEVEFAEWTRVGMIRQPSFKGLRPDKDAREVVREGTEPVAGAEAAERSTASPEAEPERAAPSRRAATPSRPAAKGRTTAELEVDGRVLRLSNLDKVLYPVPRFTKGQVIDYYIRIAPVLLPHLRDRPLTLKRYPNGVEGKHFFEKQCPRHRPDWVRTAALWSRHNERNIDYCVVDELATLVWAANLADLELHTPLALAGAIDRPTMLVFDLDPGAPADILDCARVALWLREALADMGLASFPKTSGSKGLQLYAPLNTALTYEQTKPFARALAERLEREHPDRLVSRMSKSLRPGKVLVDWSQNDEHKTTVCVYSLRARERPTVSTPVGWDEVQAALQEGNAGRLTFDSAAVLARVAQRGDLFAPMLELEQTLPAG